MLDIMLNDRLRNASSQMLTMLSQCVDVNTLFVAVNDTQINQIIRAYNRSEVLVTEGAADFLESYCNHVCRHESDLLIIPDTGADPITANMPITAHLGPLTFIGVSIVLKDGTRAGTVCGMDKGSHVFTKGEIQLLQVAATFIGYVFELEHAAYVDDVTGAYTRKYLQVVFDETVKQHRSISLIYFDVDNFKLINDSHGHDFGDDVLCAVVNRIKEYLQNRGVFFRLGGDEFAILSYGLFTPGEVIDFANEILHLFTHPLAVEAMEFFVTPSIGVALYPYCSNDLKELLGHADMAMYVAKREGGNRVSWYNPEEAMILQERLNVQERLRNALAKEELELFYQPKVRIRDGSIRSLEALARWRDQDGQWIPPDRFIPIAEESALIGVLGKWVLKTACRQHSEWMKKGLDPFVVSVNVSPKQFQLNSMVQVIRDVLIETGMDPSHLAIEITEGLLVQNSMAVAEELRQIRLLGVKIAIDDFGKGYSSLSYLRLFEPTHLKIDKSFVCDMLDDRSQMSIVSAIINLAHNLGMSVIAEGVEHTEQLMRLAAEGCDFVQGYLISRPLPADEIEGVLEQTWPIPGVQLHVV